MTTNTPTNLPRLNFVAILSGALFLVSLLLPWWGLSIAGGPFPQSFQWSLWSGASTISVGSAQSAQPLVAYSPIIGALVAASAALVLLGTVPKAHRGLIGGLIGFAVAPIAYAVLVNYAILNACSGVPNCISGPFGTQTIGRTTLTWGFQTGFYVEIIGAVLAVIAIAFHQTFLSKKPA